MKHSYDEEQSYIKVLETRSKARGEKRKPTRSQGRSATPRKESVNSNLIHFLHPDKECKILRSKYAQGKYTIWRQTQYDTDPASDRKVKKGAC